MLVRAMDQFAILFLCLWLLTAILFFIYFRKTQERALSAESYRLQLEALGTQQMSSDLEIKDLRLQNQRLIESNARAEAERDSVLKSIEREKEIYEQSKSALSESFKGLAAQALEGNNRQFMDLARSLLAKESEVIKGDLKQKEQAIDSLMKPVVELLDRYQKQTTELEKERQKSYFTVEAELKRVVDSSLRLSQETNALKNALKRPHIRGQWGELQLKNCLEMAGMSEFADFSLQDTAMNEGKKLKPDLIVKMPGGRVVVVDAKTPLDGFLEALEATTDEVRTREMARHGMQVKEHVRKLSNKGYGDHVQDAADFTVMFMPNESFLYAALETQPDLVEYALDKKILIATPPTFVGLLKVIRYGWNEERLAENARKISDLSQELHKRLVDFVESFLAIGKSLDKAKTEYDTGLKRLNSRVISQVKKLEGLGAKSHKVLPESHTGMGPIEAIEVPENEGTLSDEVEPPFPT